MGRAPKLRSLEVVEGLHYLHSRVEMTAPVAYMESALLIIAKSSRENMTFRQLDIETAFLQSKMGPDDPDLYVVPTTGFTCTEE